MEDLDTELLGQLQRWHEEDQYQRIIDAIEAIPQPERGYELTCQLARAYNNLAGPETMLAAWLHVPRCSKHGTMH